jgi:uncharacterized protein
MALGAAGLLFVAGVYLGLSWQVTPGGAERVAEEITPPRGEAARPAEPSVAERLESEAEGAFRGPAGRLALVMDDLGRSLEEIRRIEALGARVSFAVLPHEVRTGEVVAALARAGHEVLLHLPMEPGNGLDPGPGALWLGMGAGELAAGTREALSRVPGAVGVNNHMGSELTRDAAAMAVVLGVLREKGLFFLDSRTSADSVGFQLARQMGLPAAERHVFLDPDPEPEAVREQFRRMLAMAAERGAAIAIGHPYDSTLSVLEEEVPRALADGFHFVPVSYLLERDSLPAP